MLILTRRIGESIIIDDNIDVRILGVCGQQIRIGVTAPKDVGIYREEIHKRLTDTAIRVTPGETPSPMVESGSVVHGPRIVYKKRKESS